MDERLAAQVRAQVEVRAQVRGLQSKRQQDDIERARGLNEKRTALALPTSTTRFLVGPVARKCDRGSSRCGRRPLGPGGAAFPGP